MLEILIGSEKRSLLFTRWNSRSKAMGVVVVVAVAADTAEKGMVGQARLLQKPKKKMLLKIQVSSLVKYYFLLFWYCI